MCTRGTILLLFVAAGKKKTQILITWPRLFIDYPAKEMIAMQEPVGLT
jgi:hypothetical protein